jgi:hypothetical protein
MKGCSIFEATSVLMKEKSLFYGLATMFVPSHKRFYGLFILSSYLAATTKL